MRLDISRDMSRKSLVELALVRTLLRSLPIKPDDAAVNPDRTLDLDSSVRGGAEASRLNDDCALSLAIAAGSLEGR
jgi:hypothetical protein